MDGRTHTKADKIKIRADVAERIGGDFLSHIMRVRFLPSVPKMSWVKKAKDDVKATIEVSTISESNMKQFLKLLAFIQKLGSIGASRAMKLSVDGDGAARYTFSVDGKPIDQVVDMKDEQMEVPDNDSKSFGLGN